MHRVQVTIYCKVKEEFAQNIDEQVDKVGDTLFK